MKVTKYLRVLLFTSLMFISFAGSAAWAQNRTVDEIHLQNGSVLKGRIVEEEPGKTLTFETGDGSRFVYPIGDVKKIVRGSVQLRTPLRNASRVSYYSLNLGMATDFESSIGTGFSPADFNFGIGKSGFGIALSFGGTTYAHSAYYNEYKVTATTNISHLAVGPSFTWCFPTIALTPRALLGYGRAAVIMKSGNKSIEEGVKGFFLGAGMHARFFTTHRWNLLLGLDYQHFNEYNGMNVSVGFAYTW